MNWARRLLTGLLTLALAQFGVFATAPAHAHTHEEAAAHAFHAVELDIKATHDHGHPHHDHEAGVPPDADAPADEGNDQGKGAERPMHVHSCLQFAPADAFSGLAAPSRDAALKPSLLDARAVPRAPAPPLRPPRPAL